MGAGKTSVGRALAARLGWRFEDLDDRLQECSGRTVSEIFQTSGEAEFRRLEHAALRDVLAEIDLDSPLVLALGGGAFVNVDNASLLGTPATATVYLDATSDELWRRCANDSVERPLRRDKIGFRELYELRRPRYLQAQQRVETAGRNIEQIANEIIERLGLESIRRGEAT
jgi:shikimate kinase